LFRVIHFSGCIHNAAPARSISQIQTDRQFLAFNFFDLLCAAVREE